MLTKALIQSHFNDENRVRHDLENYDLKHTDENSLPIDFFEKPREGLIVEEVCKRVHTNGNILDVGCGIGQLVRVLIEKGYNAKGVDFSKGMVKAAKKLLIDNGYSERIIEHRDFMKSQKLHKYDAIILNGVIWYYEDKKPILDKICAALKPGGYAFIIHKNTLFNWFALNQGTISLVTQEILKHLSDDEKKKLGTLLTEEVPGLSTSVKKNGTLKKTSENPLDVEVIYRQSLLQVVDVAYTYIHPGIPRLNQQWDESVYAKLQALYGHQWQGLFLGSQFLVVSHKNKFSL